MYDFIILTPSFNRADLLRQAMSQLREESTKRKFKVCHVVVDDGSDYRTEKYKEMCHDMSVVKENRYVVLYNRNHKNFGKKWFYKTWNVMLSKTRQLRFNHVVSIPDDHELCDDFLMRTRQAFADIQRKDRIAVAMNILVQSKFNWQKNRFVDGAFIAKRKFFECLKWNIGPMIEWQATRWHNGPISSGVGKQMTDVLSMAPNARIAKVRNVSFLRALDCESRMFPQCNFPGRPKIWGLSRYNFVDDMREERHAIWDIRKRKNSRKA